MYLNKTSPKDEWIRAVLAYGRSTAENWLVITKQGITYSLEEREWLEELPITSISELKIRGDELTSMLGKSPGPWIADLLQHLLEAVAFEQLPNDKNSLLSAAKAYKGIIEL